MSSTFSMSESARCAREFSTWPTWRSWSGCSSGRSATSCGKRRVRPKPDPQRQPPAWALRLAPMAAQIVRFFSLVFVGIALAPGLAHILQMPHKMDLSGADYLRVQQLYAGWAWLGVVVFGALIATFALTILVRARLRQFALACIAFGSVLVTQVIFWIFTFPVNQQTQNWTALPANWMT